MIKRLKNLWILSGMDLSDKKKKAQIKRKMRVFSQSMTEKKTKSEESAEFLRPFTQNEYDNFVKTQELGWKKFFDSLPFKKEE